MESPDLHEQPSAIEEIHRYQDQRSGSKGGDASRLTMFPCPIERLVQASSGGITLDLAIPLVRHIFLKPLGENGKLLRRELRHGVLDFLNAHGKRL